MDREKRSAAWILPHGDWHAAEWLLMLPLGDFVSTVDGPTFGEQRYVKLGESNKKKTALSEECEGKLSLRARGVVHVL